MRAKFSVFILFIISAYTVSAASLDVYTDMKESYVGQPVILTAHIAAENEISRPQIPELDGFEIQKAGESRYEARSLGTGGSSRSVTMEYTWKLIPVRTGHFTIPPLTVTAGKETLQSVPISITIKEPENIEGYFLFLTASGNKAFPMIPVRINLKWLFSSEVSRPDFVIPFYNTAGIKIKDLPPPSSQTSDIYQFSVNGHTLYAVQSAEVYNGKQYASLSMSWDLYPEESGKITLDPVILSFQRGVLSRTGRKSYENAVIPSNSLTINSLPLPDEMKNFPGGILVADGSLQVTASLDQNRIYPGDPLELTLRFKGLNNPELTDFRGIGGLKEISGIIKADSSGLTSEITDSDKIIRQKIRFLTSNPKEFPGLKIPYFNLETGEVEECRSEPVQISVMKLENNAGTVPFESQDIVKTQPEEEEIGIRGNIHSSFRDQSEFSGFLYKYRYFIFSVLFLICIVSIALPELFIRKVKLSKAALSLKDLMKTFDNFEKDQSRENAHKMYDLFWKWISTLAPASASYRSHTDILNGFKGVVSTEIYKDLISLTDFLESFWNSGSEDMWKSEYRKIPERLVKQMKKSGNKR